MDLKECPFCGGKAKLFQIPNNTEDEMREHPNWKWNYPGFWVVGCDYDPICICNINRFTGVYLTAESAAEIWNRRKGDGE